MYQIPGSGVALGVGLGVVSSAGSSAGSEAGSGVSILSIFLLDIFCF